MKIAWITPSLKTGLGKYSKVAVKALSKFAEIELFKAKEKISTKLFKNFDFVIYNIGNSRDNFYVYETMREIPGVVILHDRTYHHFFAYYYLEHFCNYELYLETLEHFYGKEAVIQAKEGFEKGIPLWETELCLKYPMREHFYSLATGILIHAKDYQEIIKKEFVGPVLFLPFPFYVENFTSFIHNFSFPEDKIILFSYGFMSRNRMVEDVIKVLGKEENLRNKILYLIAGDIDPNYLKELKELIEEYELKEMVKFLGFISDEELKTYLKKADLCINLRKYSTEGASWSLLEQFYFEKPVLVMNHSFYREIPEDVCLKIEDTSQLPDLLKEICKNPNKLKNFGKKAKEYVLKNFNPQNFANKFIEFLPQTKEFEIQKTLLDNHFKELILALPSLEEDSLRKSVLGTLTNLVKELWR